MGGAPAGELTVLQQLEDMRREKEEQERRAEQLAVANANLLHNQQQLSQEVLRQRVSIPLSSSSTSTTTTATFSSLSSRPIMGTGFSSSFGTVTSSAVVTSTSAASVGSGLAAAAQTLSQLNTPASGVAPVIPGYSGPTIPDLRALTEVNNLAQQLLQGFYQQIPALAPHPSVSAAGGAPLPQHVSQALPVYPQLGGSAAHQEGVQQPLSAAYPVPSGGAVPGVFPPPYPVYQQALQPVPVYQQVAPQPQPLSGAGQSVLGVGLHPGADPTRQQQQQAPLHLQQSSQQIQDFLQIPQDSQVNSDVSLESLINVTIKCKQYTALDFAKLKKFPYISQLKESNLNLSL